MNGRDPWESNVERTVGTHGKKYREGVFIH